MKLNRAKLDQNCAVNMAEGGNVLSQALRSDDQTRWLFVRRPECDGSDELNRAQN